MTEQEIRERTQRLIKRWERVQVIGQGWAGSARGGILFNPTSASTSAVGGGVFPIGACCFTDGSCTNETEFECTADGGTYQGDGTDCADATCPEATGACCHVDGSCTVTTQIECDGTYQGDGTTCADVDCTHTGACCHETVCDIETQTHCEESGGTYQGDGTDCDPNPCIVECCPDSFTGFFGIGHYLVMTEHTVRTAHVEPTAFSDGCDVSLDITTVTTIDPLTCDTEVTCSGSAISSSPNDPSYGAVCDYVSDGFGGCTFIRTSGSGICNPACSEACTNCTLSVDSDTQESCSCDYSDPTTPANVAHLERTITLSSPCSP